MGRTAFFIFAAVCAAALAGAAPLAAMDWNGVALHGFVSQGYLKSSDNNWMAKSEQGTFQFNEAALNVSYSKDKLYVGVQTFSKDLGDQGDNAVEVDWALGDYRFADWLGFRAGRCKLPVGFYNQGRDVDALRATVFLPQSVYLEGTRDLFNVYQGGGLYGTLPLSALGDLEYEGFYGQLDVDNEGAFVQGAVEDFNRSLSSMIQRINVAGVPFSTTGLQNHDVDNKYITGGALRWATPVGLRLGATFLRGEQDVEGDVTLNFPGVPNPAPPPAFVVPAFTQTFVMKLEHTVEAYWVCSAEYTWRDLVLSTEWQRLRMLNNAELLNSGIPAQESPAESEGWYVMGSYLLFGRVTPGLQYGEYVSNVDDKDGQQRSAESGDPPYYGFQREWVPFVRVDITDNWLVKLECHFVDGAAQLYDYNNPTPRDDNWTLWAFKTTFNF